MKPKTKSVKPPRKSKPTQGEARLMWAIRASGVLSQCHLSDLMAFNTRNAAERIVNRNCEEVAPVHVLDASEAAHEARVEAGARKAYEAHAKASQIAISQIPFQWPNENEAVKNMWRMIARAVLSALHLAPVKGGKQT